MKTLKRNLIVLLFCLPTIWLGAQVEVTYNLSYDFGTQTYTVSMNSNTAYNPPLSRLTSSTQVTVVVPEGWQVTNLTGLISTTVPLGWGFSYVDGSDYGLTNDYIVFAVSNSGTYTPFSIPANADLDLFSFQSTSGCIGNLSLFDNATDPLNSEPTLNPDNNIVILGAGAGNKYAGNTSGSVSCVPPCSANAGTLSY